MQRGREMRWLAGVSSIKVEISAHPNTAAGDKCASETLVLGCPWKRQPKADRVSLTMDLAAKRRQGKTGTERYGVSKNVPCPAVSWRLAAQKRVWAELACPSSALALVKPELPLTSPAVRIVTCAAAAASAYQLTPFPVSSSSSTLARPVPALCLDTACPSPAILAALLFPIKPFSPRP